MPEDWLKQLTNTMHKKVLFHDCHNSRGIALLSVPEKVFCKVIQNRVAEKNEEILMESQCGFCSGRGSLDQIFTLRVLVETAENSTHHFTMYSYILGKLMTQSTGRLCEKC